MERRTVLKNIGLSFGFLVATPTALSILQSCQTEEPWLPSFFTEEEGIVLRKALDIIIPATETLPSAVEVNVHKFMDQYMKEVVEAEEQTLSKHLLGVLTGKLKRDTEKEELKKLKTEELEPVIAAALKKTKEEEQEIYQQMGPFVEAMASGGESDFSEENMIFVLLSNLRGLAVWGYRNTEFVGENVLAYAPIPGKQEGCVDLQETTGGKAWSLG